MTQPKLPQTRLDRLLTSLGYAARREVQGLIREGEVTLDGAPLLRGDTKIVLTPDLSDRMMVAGEKLDPISPLTLALHKPTGVVCSHTEAGMRIYDLLPLRWQRRLPPLSSVGRLDKESSGLILLTDDGQLLHRIISPKSQISKRYVVTLDRDLNGDEAALFATGTFMLESEKTPLLPAVFVATGPRSGHITITEGRYHQVRRMFAATGNHVTALSRDKIGGLDLPLDLKVGDFHLLSHNDVAKLFTKPQAP
ncbi:MAG: pseudouridine synthase [Pseudomonadota bacterium]